MTPADLEQLMLAAMIQADFQSAFDYHHRSTLHYPPSVDLSLIVFPPEQDPVYANVLLSRDFPRGMVATIDPLTLRVQNVRWRQDRGDQGRWDEPDWQFSNADDLVPGCQGIDFVSPYPASVLKLMVGIKILQLVDASQIDLEEHYTHRNTLPGSDASSTTRTIRSWLQEMLRLSDDQATFALLKLLHDLGEIASTEWQPDLPPEQQCRRSETRNTLNHLFQQLGLPTLQITNTRPWDGSFYTNAGSGVGSIHMTSWDTARLLWLLDRDAPQPTWRAPDQNPVEVHFLSDASKRFLVEDLLSQQGFHEALSTCLICGCAGVRPGIPAYFPTRWINPDGCSVSLADNGVWQDYTGDVRPCNQAAEVIFAHKTGSTVNYGSNVGIVQGMRERGFHRHYIISFFSNLGYRYTDHAQPDDPAYAAYQQRGICYTQRIAAMAAELDRGIKQAVGDWGVA